MLCPACRQLIQEQVQSCPHCGFELSVAGRHFGAAPHLKGDITDLAGVLSDGDKKMILEAVKKNMASLPQVRFAAVITRVPPQMPMRAYTFWLFNQPGLNSPMDKGSACRLVLLVVDADERRIACMVGYGLEPFVGEDALGRIMNAALPALQEQDYACAISDAFDQAGTELAAISRTIPAAFGLRDNEGQEFAGGEIFAY